MGILCQQKFNLILEIIVILSSFDLMNQLLIDGHQL